MRERRQSLENASPTRYRRTTPRAQSTPSGRSRDEFLDLMIVLLLLAIVVALSVFWLISCSMSANKDASDDEPDLIKVVAPDEVAGEEPDEPQVDTDHPESTPASEWHQGEMPYLYQIDPAYADLEYSGGRFAKQGCGPTALCMVYIYLTGNTDLDPASMAAFATQNGYSTDGNGTAWAFMSSGAQALGLTCWGVDTSEAEISNTLANGHPIICLMNPGIFTEVGHFIVLVGLDDDGKVIIRDSNSYEHSHQTWDVQTIVSEADQAWGYSL